MTSDPNHQRFVGFVDGSEGGVIHGWAVDRENLDRPAEVDIYLNGVRTRTIIADLDRPDLLNLFEGKTHYGFYCDLKDAGRLDAYFGGTLKRIPASTRPSRSAASFEISPRDLLFDTFLDAFSGDRDKAVAGYLGGGRECADRFAALCREYFYENPKTVLDFASGYGRVARFSKEVLPDTKWVCCDIHPEAVDFLENSLGLEAFPSFTKPEAWSPDRKYDVVFALSFFSHTPDATFAAWLGRLLDAVEPGGMLVFTTRGEISLQVMRNKGLYAQFNDEGLCWTSYSDQTDLDLTDYGSMAVTKDYVDRVLQSLPLAESLRFQQAFWWKNEDLHVVRKRKQPLATRKEMATSRPRPAGSSVIVDIKLNVDEASICDSVATLQDFLSFDKHCSYKMLERPGAPPSGIVPTAFSGDLDYKQRWQVSKARLADLYLFKIRNALVFPTFGVVVTEAGEALRHSMGEAANKTPDLQLLHGAFRRDGGTALKIPDDTKRFEKISVTMPWGAKANYGHFLLDTLPAAVTLDRHGLLDSHQMITPNLEKWQRRHFDLLRLDPIELSDEVIWADEVIYTSAMHYYLHAPNLNYLDVVHRQRDHVLPASSKTAARIYLSRGENRRRILVSEDLLIDRLLALDFQVLDPASLTIDDQIACFKNADVVVGPTGAAFANVLYCRPGTQVIEIQPTGMESYWIQILCAICGSRCLTYGCNSLSGDTRTQLTFDIDVQRFLDSMLRFIAEVEPRRTD